MPAVDYALLEDHQQLDIILTKPGSIASLSIPDYRELAPGTQRKLIRAAGITVEEFRAALGCGCRSGGGRPTRAARRPGVHPVR